MYVSVFGDWDQHASVRIRPRRIVVEDDLQRNDFFPGALVPVANLKAVRECGVTAQRLLRFRQLMRYLEFTAALEHFAVNVVTQGIAHRQYPLEFHDGALFDAYRIYCDEAYHGLFSEDLRRQIILASGFRPVSQRIPQLVVRLQRLLRRRRTKERDLILLFFAIVSETLITSSLVVIPKDTTVVAAVRDMVADHARDEALHHVFFSYVLEAAWPQLVAQQKALIGPLLPELIHCFLDPDFDAIVADLQEIGFEANDAAQLVGLAYPKERVAASLAEGSAASLRLFSRVGLLSDTATRDAFLRHGFDLP